MRERSDNSNTAKMAGNLQPMSRVRKSVDGKLLREDIKGRRILTEGGSRTYTSKVKDEEIRY